MNRHLIGGQLEEAHCARTAHPAPRASSGMHGDRGAVDDVTRTAARFPSDEAESSDGPVK
jgi:hypothetical protein